MARPWLTIFEWCAARNISAAQFRELEAAGVAPGVSRCAHMKIVTEEASANWEKSYGVRVVNELFSAAQSGDQESGDGVA